MAVVLLVVWKFGSEGGCGSTAVTMRIILNAPSTEALKDTFWPVKEANVVPFRHSIRQE